MSDDLFNELPATGPDELTAARSRMAKAQEAIVAADAAQDELGVAIPRDVRNELDAARRALSAAEYRALHRFKS